MGSKRKPPKAPDVSGESNATVDVRERLLADVRAFNAWRKANLGVAIDLTDADLRGADLRDAFLAGAKMNRCQLDDACLAGAVLAGASLDEASLRRADLRGACFGHVELIESSLAFSPVGSALVSPASLRGAVLVAARAQGARLREVDLGGADLTDCDLRDADLVRANLEDAKQGPPPPAMGDTNAMFERLLGEPREVREGMALFAVLTFRAGRFNHDSQEFVTAIVDRIGLTSDEAVALVPSGSIQLETVSITPPSSDWARRVYFALMCAVAEEGQPVPPAQRQVLEHFGAQFGLSSRAIARIIREEV
jgi:hypothetical protein